MRIFISADIEGTCGIVDWQEASINHEASMYHRVQMTEEVNAACKGANTCGCEYILVKDAHSTARNIIPSNLEENVNILRGWTGDPLGMMSGIDNTFDAAIFIGYHSSATMDGNPLSHTKNASVVDYIKINGQLVGEYTINSYTAAYHGVPVVFLSGDELLCANSKTLNPNIITMPVSRGIGGGAVSINPKAAVKNIKERVQEALSDNLDKYMIKLPENFKVEIGFKNHFKAYRASFYPGAFLIGSTRILFETNDYMEVLKLLLFTI
ncbi:MAG: M55 family metallopeptidase [Paraclostridium sp.]